MSDESSNNVEKVETDSNHMDDTIKATFPKFYKRFLAYTIDSLLLLVLFGIFYIPAIKGTFLFVFYYFVFLFIVFYQVYMHGKFGQTVGKMVMKIKVVNMDGEDINYKVAFIRHLPFLILGVMSEIEFVGFIFQNFADISDKSFFEVVTYMTNMKVENGNYDLFSLENVAIYLSTLYLVLAVIILFSNKTRRTIHDYLAKTIVVDK